MPGGSDGRRLERLLQLAQAGDAEKLAQFVAANYASPAEWLAAHSPSTGDTAVVLAGRSGSVRLLGHLLACGADFAGQSNFEGKRALHEAAQIGALAAAEWLLTVAMVPVDPLKRADWTPLMLASTKPCEPMLSLLLAHGARPDLVNKDGWTPLHLACRLGRPDCVRRLLAAGPGQAGRAARNGRTPAHTLALHGHAGLLAELLAASPSLAAARDSCGCTPALEAAKSGSVDCLRVVAAALAASDATTSDDDCDSIGYTCLHYAAMAGQPDAVRHLLMSSDGRLPADTVGRTRDRVTPLHLACREGHAGVVRQLLADWGASPAAADARGRTPADYTRIGRSAECLQVLDELAKTS